MTITTDGEMHKFQENLEKYRDEAVSRIAEDHIKQATEANKTAKWALLIAGVSLLVSILITVFK